MKNITTWIKVGAGLTIGSMFVKSTVSIALFCINKVLKKDTNNGEES